MERRDVRIYGEPLPLFVYSFSSKGFADFRDIVTANIQRIPVSFLVSLYDYKYLFNDRSLTNEQETRVRVWDSGGYETSEDDDLSSHFRAIKGDETWEEATYVEAACSIPWNARDILVSFDSYENRATRSISQQIENACRLFERIPGPYMRDILLHVDGDVEISSLVNEIRKYDGCFDVIGFTEKEVAYTWYKGIHFLTEIRRCLDSELGKYVPIHLFGCFDPKSIIYFFLCGADVFDGLSWLRYFVRGRRTLYIREYEKYVPMSQQAHLDFYRPEVVANNIEELSVLRNDLSFALLAQHYDEFCNELTYVHKSLGIAP